MAGARPLEVSRKLLALLRMEDTQFLKDLWTYLILDGELRVVRIETPDDRLFFGKCPVIGQKLTETFPDDTTAQHQAAHIVEAIGRAKAENRTVYLEYFSQDAKGDRFPVMAHIGCCENGTIRIQATTINADDLRRTHETKNAGTHPFQHTLQENLPIGLEIYDSQGRLTDINSQEMKLMGVRNKSDVLGLDLFSNPNIPPEVLAQLKMGEDVNFTSGYDFDRAESEYYTTTMSGNRHFAGAISIIRNPLGQIDKYLLTAHDITERIEYQHKYEVLYNQTMTILNSLPVGVEIYSSEGILTYLTDTDCRIFGVDRDTVLKSPVKIDDNPNLPQKVKDAVHMGVAVQARFPYNFNTVSDQEYYTSSHQKQVIQIECIGQPITGPDGKLLDYVFIVKDITEDVRREEELRQSKQKTQVAMLNTDTVIWEFNVNERQFFSENEPLNGYNPDTPLSIQDYTDVTHEGDRSISMEVIRKMASGEDWHFQFDARFKYPENPDWQYCTVSGSPYERDSTGKVLKYVGSRKNNTVLQRKQLLQDNILNNIPLSIHIKDVEDNLRYVFCNDESTRLFGTSLDKTLYDVMDDEQVGRIEKTDKEVFSTGNPYLGLEHIVLKDGRSYDTIVRKSVIYDGNKRLLLNIRWDQSLQNDLQRRAKMLSLSMQMMNAYTWFFEPEIGHISFGEGFERPGRSATQINSLESFAECVHPHDKDNFLSTLLSLLKQQSGEWAIEYRVALNGSQDYEWWETRGMLETAVINDAPHRYMLGMSINIDAHKKTELMLRSNKEELKNLIRQNELVLNNTNSGLAYITPDYIVQWENISACPTSLSYQAYKKGECCYKSVHARTSPCENCVMTRALNSRQTEQIKFTLKNNRTVEVFGTPVLGADDTIEGIVIRIDDITDREQLFEELKLAKAQAEQSDKLKSAFLANMSHEIRTPLNAIVGFSELLMTANEEAEQAEYIQIINNNNELLLKLINDILDLSKIEAGSVELKYEVFDLSEYFDGMAASMKLRIKNPNVRLIAVNPLSKCIVELDRNRIAQILTNYVTNAIKYTPKGFIEMGYECMDKGVRLYVKDSGIGISDQKKEKVFHRFEKLDEFAQGTGLGLSICKAIAESMGGSVGFESQCGEGSLFWAILPCKIGVKIDRDAEIQEQERDTKPSEATPNTAERSSERKTVLVAEDIASNYLLISALLKKRFNLLHAVNGLQAVEIARTQPVDLVMMDMKMPGMDGLEATTEIRKFNRTLPIVALTAHAFDTSRLAALTAGCDDYLIKPIDKTKLMAMLDKYCGTHKDEK